MSRIFGIAVVAAVVSLIACGRSIPTDENTQNQDGGVIGLGGYDDAGLGLPCAVVDALQSCKACHAHPPSNGAVISLVTRADLMTVTPFDDTWGQRAVMRMRAADNPMPPPPESPLPAAAIAEVDAWVQGGMPVGACDPFVKQPAPTVCTSNSYWARGNRGSADMNPGWACRSCHQGKNFNGQNPTGEREREIYPLMGTIFPTEHEKDLCNGSVPAGVKIEIIDANDAVVGTAKLQAKSGNFWFSGQIAMPYRARVTYNGKVKEMHTWQTEGDCNVCHTEQGEQGAAGRIYWPQ